LRPRNGMRQVNRVTEHLPGLFDAPH
jgi:hypothetical protein